MREFQLIAGGNDGNDLREFVAAHSHEDRKQIEVLATKSTSTIAKTVRQMLVTILLAARGVTGVSTNRQWYVSRYTLFFLAVLFFISCPEPSKANDTDRFDDKVVSVPASGEVTFENNPPGLFWALQILEPEKLNSFLTGRKITCTHIEYQFVDCSVWTTDVYSLDPDVQMDLFIWLPELGWAVRFCDEDIYSLEVIMGVPHGLFLRF